jgi:hypothetical protein
MDKQYSNESKPDATNNANRHTNHRANEYAESSVVCANGSSGTKTDHRSSDTK